MFKIRNHQRTVLKASRWLRSTEVSAKIPLKLISQLHLDVVKCHTVFQACHFGFYQQVPLNVVNEASSTLAKLAFVL